MSIEEVSIKFSKRLVQLREEKGISQEELALRSGVNRTYIGRIERLERNPSLVILDKLAKGLEMTLVDLLDFSSVE